MRLIDGKEAATMSAQIIAIGLLTFIAVAAIADAIITAEWGQQSSISHVIMSASLQYPIIPFIVGFLMGHFFWPQHVQDVIREAAEKLPPVH